METKAGRDQRAKNILDETKYLVQGILLPGQ